MTQPVKGRQLPLQSKAATRKNPAMGRLIETGRSLALLGLIVIFQSSTTAPSVPPIQALPSASIHYAPPFNETLPGPVPLTVPLGYKLTQSGSQSLIVLCVEFTNLNHSKSRSEIEDTFFNKVSQYYREASYGRVSLAGQISRWYQMNKTVGAYGRDGLNVDDPNGDGTPDSWMLIQEAIDAADSEIDFSRYSYLVLLHAGPGQETSGNTNDLWSCAYLMGVWFRTRDGVSFSKAMIVPETESQGADIVGVIAHEFGHLLGLPDLYDPYGKSDYVGKWDLMGRGTWNGNPPGSSPAHMLAWSKIRLGWISESQIAVVRSGVIVNVTLSAIELNGTTLAVKIPITDSTYYLIEHRQRIGYDLGLPDAGLLVAYIDGSSGGPGSVRIVDANPLTATLDDCLFKPGRTFSDTTNKIFVSISEMTGQGCRLLVNRIGPAPDLLVTKPEITPYPPRSGRILTFTFRITNQGTTAASSFTVSVYVDAVLIYTGTYTLEPEQSQLIPVTWNATLGKHTARCIVDPENRLADINRLNNEATYEFVVGSILSVRLPWAGGSITVNGTTYTANGTMTIEVPVLHGQQTIEVPHEHKLSAGQRWVFTRWGDGDTSNPRIYVTTDDAVLRAEYKTQYRLMIDSNKGATSGDGWYDENSTATAAATTPILMGGGKTRLVFSHWTGTQNSNSSTLQILMTRPHNLTANWIVEHYLTILSEVNFGQQGWYREGTTVQLRASSPIDQGNHTRKVFVNWSGNVTSESQEITISISGPATVAVNWRTEYELQVLSEYGTPLGQGWVSAGAQAKFSVEPIVSSEPGSRHVFVKWSGDYDGDFHEGSVVMNSPKTVRAIWKMQHLVSLRIVGLPNGTTVPIRFNSKSINGTVPFDLLEWVDAGTSLAPEAPSKVHASIDEYVFREWRDSEGRHVSLPQTITSARSYELVYLRKPKGLIDVLEATYGSDNLPELSLLKQIRDQQLPRTFAGGHWSEAFDQLCHSLAPNIPKYISENAQLKTIMAGLLYPLLRILTLAASFFTMIGPSSEFSFFAAGSIASILTGAFYLTPFCFLVVHLLMRRKSAHQWSLPKFLVIVLVIGAELAILGEITYAPITTTASVFLYFATVASLSGVMAAISIFHIVSGVRSYVKETPEFKNLNEDVSRSPIG